MDWNVHHHAELHLKKLNKNQLGCIKLSAGTSWHKDFLKLEFSSRGEIFFGPGFFTQ